MDLLAFLLGRASESPSLGGVLRPPRQARDKQTHHRWPHHLIPAMSLTREDTSSRWFQPRRRPSTPSSSMRRLRAIRSNRCLPAGRHFARLSHTPTRFLPSSTLHASSVL